MIPTGKGKDTGGKPKGKPKGKGKGKKQGHVSELEVVVPEMEAEWADVLVLEIEGTEVDDEEFVLDSAAAVSVFA